MMESNGHAVLLVDSDPHLSELLMRQIAARGHRASAVAPEAVSSRLTAERFDALVLDFHHDRPDELETCRIARGVDRGLPIVVVASPGPATQLVEAYQARSQLVDDIVRKPLAGDAFFKVLTNLVLQRRGESLAGRYASLISEEGRSWVDSGATGPSLSEQAILFTDIRRSTELVSSLLLPEWFAAINRSLIDQGVIVRESGGSIVKYTGDGLLAAFRGRGRSHFALRCAIALQQLDMTASYRATLRAGFGIAEGLVMSGLVGEPGRQQYDVIGATVHLAARLCSIANEGEIVATPKLVRAAAMPSAQAKHTRAVNLRGFAAPIECISF
jgi:adenylate cyclase